jgi:pantoate--beta-alanine ligase
MQHCGAQSRTRLERKADMTANGSSGDRPEVVRTVVELRKVIAGWRQSGDAVALVPTMGALHDGHVALVSEGLRHCQRVVTSIFVNPTQFAPTEDFGTYPRTFDSDRAKLAAARCDLIWAPTVDVMYPAGFATRVVPAGAADGLETDYRPQFFSGVATVCCKLFTQVGPDIAVFGEKDYQQLQVVRQMVRDLDLPLSIVGHPTVREPDGLAMSSRNAYLSAAERKIAPVVNRAIVTAAGAVRSGVKIAEAEAQGAAMVEAAGLKVDYVAIRDAETLATVDAVGPRPLRALVAAWLGKTRLIDNIAV